MGLPVDPEVNRTYASDRGRTLPLRSPGRIGLSSMDCRSGTVGSRQLTPGSAERSRASCDGSATTQVTSASETIVRNRSSGASTSSGRYAPPALRIPYTVATCSRLRDMATATTESGPTPRAIRARARLLPRASNCAYVSVRSPSMNAMASGVAATCSANSSIAVRSVISLRVAFQVSSCACSSSASSRSSSRTGVRLACANVSRTLTSRSATTCARSSGTREGRYFNFSDRSGSACARSVAG